MFSIKRGEPEPDKFSNNQRVWVRVYPDYYNESSKTMPARVEQKLENDNYLVRMLEQKAGKWVLSDLPVEVSEVDLAPRERKL